MLDAALWDKEASQADTLGELNGGSTSLEIFTLWAIIRDGATAIAIVGTVFG